MSNLLKITSALYSIARIGGLVLAILLCVARAPLARADTMLLATTDLVSGTSAATFSFTAPSSGMVTAEISSVPWPVPLGALSFSAGTTSTNLAQWSGSSPTTPQMESFQVGAGTYFAHVTATAAGSLDLGLYSLLVNFAPSTVPLPPSDWMLLVGVFVLFGLVRTLSVLTPFEVFKSLKEAT